jgi:secreted trypsin-like serine protease
VTDFIKHENYDRNSKQNDIALVKLAKEVAFSSLIRPACLWQNSQLNSGKVTAIGWGIVGYYQETSDDLLKVEINVFDNSECVHQFEDDYEIVINDNQICAGVRAGGKDTCQGGR